MSSFKTIKKKKTILQRLPTYDTRRYNIYQFFLINIINDKIERIKKLNVLVISVFLISIAVIFLHFIHTQLLTTVFTEDNNCYVVEYYFKKQKQLAIAYRNMNTLTNQLLV